MEIENDRKLSFTYKDIDKDRLIIFLPGVSGNAMTDRFKHLEEIATFTGFSMARMDFQFQQYKDESLTINDCIRDVNSLLEYLKRRDINHAKEIVIIAKSFGGLIYQLLNIKIDKAILLAPFFILKDNDMKYINIPLKDLSSERYLDKKVLKDVPTLIIHGIKDVIIKVDNSLEISKQNTRYQLLKINTDHSFNETETQKTIVKNSIKFIQHGNLKI